MQPRLSLLARQVRRAEPWTGSAECYGSVASIRRITSLYPPYNSSLVGGLRLKEREAKSKSHSSLVRRPTRRSRGRGVMLWPVSPSFRPPAPLSSGVGRVEERARPRRAAGSTALFGRGCAGRESIRLHHVVFWALVVVRGVSVCSSPLVFQPGVVQAVRPPSPRSAFARVSGWAARFRFWLGRRAKCRPCPKPNPALKGTRGYALACFPQVSSARAP